MDISPERIDILNQLAAGGDVPDVEPEAEPMDMEELVDISYKRCYACENINSESMNENSSFLEMMKLYTDNATTICKDAIFLLIKQYFDENIKPDLQDLDVDGPENGCADWSLECIKEHFLCHTQFPTDEILTQLRLKRAIRTHLANNIVERKSNGTLKFNLNNIKMMNALDKEIMLLLRSMKEIPSMVGYSEVLNF